MYRSRTKFVGICVLLMICGYIWRRNLVTGVNVMAANVSPRPIVQTDQLIEFALVDNQLTSVFADGAVEIGDVSLGKQVHAARIQDKPWDVLQAHVSPKGETVVASLSAPTGECKVVSYSLAKSSKLAEVEILSGEVVRVLGTSSDGRTTFYLISRQILVAVETESLRTLHKLPLHKVAATDQLADLIVSNDQVILVFSQAVVCVDWNGSERWGAKFPETRERPNGANCQLVRRTCVARDAVVYVASLGELVCLRGTDGTSRWAKSVAKEHVLSVSPSADWTILASGGKVVAVQPSVGGSTTTLTGSDADGEFSFSADETKVLEVAPLRMIALDRITNSATYARQSNQLKIVDIASGKKLWEERKRGHH